MDELLPYRHKSGIGEKLNLTKFPNDVSWNGSIIYLDRDGVINKGSENYINSRDEFVLLPDVAKSLARLRKSGFRTCLVTNQSPINRGYWSHKTLEEIHEKMIEELSNLNVNAVIDLILYSPYSPEENSISRKPGTGMLRAGNIILNSSELGINLPSNFDSLDEALLFEEGSMSAMVGDRYVDYQAGKSHGVRTFMVNPNSGLSEVINRILDKNDKGDVLH
ncbi:MAG: hypothetical protein CMA27_00835 [Euryarchaeota archaeon]|nr:hypothetical protein [Euryarchaeota archaeon]